MLSAAAYQDPRTTTALKRAIGFLAFWLILSGFRLGDLPAGLLAAACASWASLRFLPPGRSKRHPILIARLMARFLQQSVVAGFDVALRALDPGLPLAPGIAVCRCASPMGALRSGFCTMASLQPGLLPAGFDADGNLVVHCLDVDQPVARMLADEEKRFLRALGTELHHA